MAFIYYNANPKKRQVGDCTIRAISKALKKTWDSVYIALMVYGLMLYDMPSANAVWGAYLRSKGFRREVIPLDCTDCYSVKDFCIDNPHGTYILSLPNHVITVIDGNYYDTWDSGDEIPIYFWSRKDDA